MAESKKINVGEYLLLRLKEIGVDDIFGVPGDFVFNFFDQIEESSIRYIGCCNELNAAYASDGYARLHGIGCFSSTFAVGELSALNAIAGAFAEKVPVVVVTGSPPREAIEQNKLLHHTIGDFSAPTKIFQQVTCAQTTLMDPLDAPAEIDRVLSACVKKLQPVYINLPSDVCFLPCDMPKKNLLKTFNFSSNKSSLHEALDEAVNMIEISKLPVFVADLELCRFHLSQQFQNLIETSGIPFVTMLLGKAIVDESHPLFLGLYQGANSREYIKTRVENEADCVIELGTFYSDLNTGGFTRTIDSSKLIRAFQFKVQIKHHIYEDIYIGDFIEQLQARLKFLKRDFDTLHIKTATEGCVHKINNKFEPQFNQKLTVSRLFDRLATIIPQNSIIIAETGVSLFSAANMQCPKGSTFIGQTFFGSIGYTVGACLGAAVSNERTALKKILKEKNNISNFDEEKFLKENEAEIVKNLRPVVLLIGDGSFQVTCQEISTMIRYQLSPLLICLLNNDGYTIERVIKDGNYNNIQAWKYHEIPRVFGGVSGEEIFNEGDLEKGLALFKQRVAEKNKKSPLTFLHLHTDRLDCEKNLKNAGMMMNKANKNRKNPANLEAKDQGHFVSEKKESAAQ